jgi:hypothetical protein
MNRLCILASLALGLTATTAFAVTVEPRMAPLSATNDNAAPPPARLADAAALAPFATLIPASLGAQDQLTAMLHHNQAGKVPLQNGFSRVLPDTLKVRLAPIAGDAHAARIEAGGLQATSAGADGYRWTARVQVASSWRLRLHLANAKLPPGTQMWVLGPAGEPAKAFDTTLVGPNGDLWTPSVSGPQITLEIQLPPGTTAAATSAAVAAFDVDRVLEMVGSSAGATPSAASTSCLVDGKCVNSGTLGIIANYRHAVADLYFVDSGDGFVCSGGLLNDSSNSGTPYFLTANHCISTQVVATTLEAFWDYYTATCNGTAPAFSSLQVTNAATLLATSTTSDFTFLRLSSVPSGRYFLGWQSAAVNNGAKLFRLSHPCPECPDGDPRPQMFSEAANTTAPQFTCPTDPSDPRPWNNLSDFLHSAPVEGTVFGGSSGSPVVVAGGYVVGQLLGSCGTQNGIDDPCNHTTSYELVDGAFSASFPHVSAWLSPSVSTGPCVPDATTLCIDDQAGDKRFKVQVPFSTTQSGGLSGSGHPVNLTSLGIERGGLFWFFSADNPEMLVKVINGCTLNQNYWVFMSAATNVGLTITVTDTVTGHSWTSVNADLTAVATVQDTAALPCS